MTRPGLSLAIMSCLLPAMAAFAAQTPPAVTSPTVPASTSVATAAPASTAAPTVDQTPPSVLPTRGMDMANVEHIYGPPLQKLPPVPAKGTPHHPPITRWVYPNFVVYFEYNHVVHSVTKAHPFKDSGGHNP